MKKADYSAIAGDYDKGRTLSQANMDLWLGLISQMSGVKKGARVLDIGCGTGRFTIPMAEKLGYRMTGIDPSVEMLDEARRKDPGGTVAWAVGDAQDLSLPDYSYDMVFMSMVLHHCDDPARALAECFRVLKAGGVMLLRYPTIEDVQDEPVQFFFPETRPFVESRMIPPHDIVALFQQAGFVDIRSERVLQITSQNAGETYERIAVKSLSPLTVISDTAFRKGLQRLKAYVEKHPDDPWLLQDTLRMTAGVKPSR